MNQTITLPIGIYNEILNAYNSLGKFVEPVKPQVKSTSVPKTVRLSKKASKRYAQMQKDFEQNKNVFVASSVDEMMKHLLDQKT